MTDPETPWAAPEAVPAEAQWFDEGPFTQGGEAFVEESWAAETPLAELPVPEARTGERWPESPFETPVEGFLEEGAAGQWESFSDPGTAAQGEGVPGCGGPVSGTPPLIYRTSSPDRSRNPCSTSSSLGSGPAPRAAPTRRPRRRATSPRCEPSWPPSGRTPSASTASSARVRRRRR